MLSRAVQGKLLQDQENIAQAESVDKIVTGKRRETTAEELVASREGRNGGAGGGELYP